MYMYIYSVQYVYTENRSFEEFLDRVKHSVESANS